MSELTQDHYPKIEIDTREADVFILWQNGEPIFIERDKLQILFDIIELL